MADWSKNNLACRTTWIGLRILELNLKVFKDSGTVPMTELQFWNAADSVEIRTVKAQTISIQLDNIFTLMAGATYESGSDKITTVEAMTEVLITSDKTIADVAAVADEHYHFVGESL